MLQWVRCHVCSFRTVSPGTLAYAVSFDVRTFTFLIRVPGRRIAGFRSPRGFRCALDPDATLRCVARRSLAANRQARGRIRLRTRARPRSGGRAS